MSFRFRHTRVRRTLLLAGLTAALPAGAQQSASPTPHQRANWALAQRFDPQALRSVVLSTTVQPRWLGETDSLWYNWRDKTGSHFYLVLPDVKVKKPLFDHAKLAASLTELHHKPYDATTIPFTAITFTRDHKAFHFNVDSTRYEWALIAQTLKSLGKIPRDSVLETEERDRSNVGRGGGGGGGFGGNNQEFRNWSPDSSAFVFARNHNLYIVEKPKNDTVQITTDGVKDYSFGARDTTLQILQQQQQQQDDGTGGGGGGGQNNRDPRVRANVVWSPDSKAFAIIRNDQRTVGELYLVNVLNNPRPSMSAYRYAMPGEENVGQSDLYVFRRGEKGVVKVNVKHWKDQRLSDVHFPDNAGKVRLVRRDRPQRNVDFIEIDLATNQVKTLLAESIENASVDPLPVRYVHRGGDFVWWSERSGWGHVYLYDHNGTFKKALTEGPWHVENVAQVDTIKGTIWVNGNGHEPGENVYYQHLYRMNADGSMFTLMDAGNFNHTETISPTRKYAVDNFSRIDAPTKVVLRDAVTGKVAMDLEEYDISRLKEMGWKPPEQFITKAGDGITDIYGVMFKPFDFDSTKKYPIVAYVYPGPQTESIAFGFVPTATQQQLAQLGIIVIEIGNRGGSPQRSLAYHRFGYYNLRDYALADKKTGIEQLAAKNKWIDIDRVGMYGHSGGGFLTAAALMLPPYNDFFKVGVSSSGNHDNNIYNQNWSEWNHGLKAVAQRSDSGRTFAGRGGRGSNGGGGNGANGANGATGATGNGVQQAGSARRPRDPEIVDDSVQYEIHVPTNIELAPNLKGRLLLTTGDMDNNVHPGNTIRMVNALIKANKRFDFMEFPGKPHGYGDMQPYFNRMMMEYFAEHLIGDYLRGGAEIK